MKSISLFTEKLTYKTTNSLKILKNGFSKAKALLRFYIKFINYIKILQNWSFDNLFDSINVKINITVHWIIKYSHWPSIDERLNSKSEPKGGRMFKNSQLDQRQTRIKQCHFLIMLSIFDLLIIYELPCNFNWFLTFIEVFRTSFCADIAFVPNCFIYNLFTFTKYARTQYFWT